MVHANDAGRSHTAEVGGQAVSWADLIKGTVLYKTGINNQGQKEKRQVWVAAQAHVQIYSHEPFIPPQEAKVFLKEQRFFSSTCWQWCQDNKK